MSGRSRGWWAAALVVSSAGLAYSLFRGGAGFAWFAFGYCPARDLYYAAMDLWWPARAYLPLAWYGGLPGIVLAFLAHLIGTRAGRPRAGRAVARVVAVLLLVLFALAPLALAADLARGFDCLGLWGGPPGVLLFVAPDAAVAAAALCVLAAVRIPRHQVRRLLRAATRPRRSRRSAPALAVLVMAGFLPVADLAAGDIDRDVCEARAGDGPASGAHGVPYSAGEREFLCEARAGTRFRNVSDRDLLAYGRAACDAYRPGDEPGFPLAPICSPAEADLRKRDAAEKAGFEARRAANRRACDEARHRPLVRPFRVAHAMLSTDFGIIESAEVENPFDDGLLDRVPADGLVAALPGHLMIITHSDFDNCLTAELYRRRPPVETKGWDHVVEIGYQSTTGHIELDPLGGLSDLPNLAFEGKGRYGVRVHYRDPTGDPGTTQDLLVMIYPGRSLRTIEYTRES